MGRIFFVIYAANICAGNPKVFIDAGSSGCKVFAEGEKAGQSKALSTKFNIGLAECSKEQAGSGFRFLKANDEHLCYKDGGAKKECKKAEVMLCQGDACDCYRRKLFESVSNWLRHHFTVTADEIQVKIMATAGMRLNRNQETIWENICAKTDTFGGVTLSTYERGRNCGTIPGTDEARYEWFALKDSYNQGQDRTGLMDITSGGASAQIAIFLPKGSGSDRAEKAFRAAQAKLRVHLKGKINSSSNVQFFTVGRDEPAELATRDFLSWI